MYTSVVNPAIKRAVVIAPKASTPITYVLSIIVAIVNNATINMHKTKPSELFR